MGYDLQDAYQQLANAPSQRRRLAFSVEDQIFVWLRGMFGVSTMAAIFGQLCDLTCAWLEHQWPSVLARHFADDHLIADTSQHQALTEQHVLSEVELLPLWMDHTPNQAIWLVAAVELLGFRWDLDALRVELTPHKRDKYLAKISHLLRQAPAGQAAFVYDYKEISSLIGSLVHTCAIFTARRSRLNALYAHRNRLHPKWRGHGLHLPRDVRRELKDWAHFLQTSDLSASFDLPVHTSSHIVYSDASNEGCGVVVDGQARFWPLAKQAHEAEVDIGVMEMWALHLALQTVVALGSRDSVVSFHVDNLGVVFAARKGRSRSKLTNHCLSDLALRAMAANIVMSIVYVASADNLADAPSRGDVSAFAPLKVNLAEPWVDILGSATPNED
ncbi:hypothetical protein A4X13_0g8557 [Tilletia indica]|uniref:Uncharacterized protein n=1 Tax=Tilletia indica TaxID=43049 RepID=A0A8T8SES8_9BASI|nr:hypothetical protein A4X13_0g8557 [Tilletia indica]